MHSMTKTLHSRNKDIAFVSYILILGYFFFFNALSKNFLSLPPFNYFSHPCQWSNDRIQKA